MERQPTQKQIAYIRHLAREKGVRVSLEGIESLEEASKMIDSLKARSPSANPATAGYGTRKTYGGE